MGNPKFIITRFTHGSAGKFLSTVLQTSNWSAVVQAQKNTELIEPVTLEYVDRSFPKDHSQYLISQMHKVWLSRQLPYDLQIPVH